MTNMDKYLLALLGEAGASGLAKGFSIRYKAFQEAYLEEKEHWKYFKEFRTSFLEIPVFISLFMLGLLFSFVGERAVRYVNRKAEQGAINFYKERFRNEEKIKEILNDELKHLSMSYRNLRQ
ncbi:hypothetical protein [Sulfuracidifex metallicus]|nr:hypothetical protein [Sulfuracidifex metallicus]